MAHTVAELASQSLSRCPHNGRLLAAVSGGADSTAMLSVCAPLCASMGIALSCFHFDHGIRPLDEREGDADFVRALCASLGLPFSHARCPEGKILEEAAAGGLGVEAVARRYRHEALRRAADSFGASHILVAHNADDRLEQVLMRFLRGSGPRGLSLMPESRGVLWRPLLEASRADILEYLDSSCLGFRTDSTNADPAYFRNRVRLKLIPFLDREFPFWRSAVLGLARTQSDVASFLETEALSRLPFDPEAEPAGLSEQAFFAEHKIIREEALFLAMDRLSAGATPRSPLGADARASGRAEPRRAVLGRFCTGEGPSVVDMGMVELVRSAGRVTLRKKSAGQTVSGFSCVLSAPGSYFVQGFLLELGLSGRSERFPPCPVQLPAVARSLLPEDRIVLGGQARRCRHLFAGISGEPAGFLVEDGVGVAALIAHRGEEVLRVWLRDEIVDRGTMRSGFSFLY